MVSLSHRNRGPAAARARVGLRHLLSGTALLIAAASHLSLSLLRRSGRGGSGGPSGGQASSAPPPRPRRNPFRGGGSAGGSGDVGGGRAPPGARRTVAAAASSGAKNATATAAASLGANDGGVGAGLSAVPLHFVVSSDCSPYQRWQVLTQAHSALSVGQRGRYTWIASGCPEGDDDRGDPKKQLTREIILKDVSEHFARRDDANEEYVGRPQVHFTPDYSNMSVYGGPFADGTVKRTFLNRNGKVQRSNFGNSYKFNNKPNGLRHWAEARYGSPPHPDEAIVLIDPDFLFLAPFALPAGVEVAPGRPVGAKYGLGGQWLDFNRTAICGSGSPCLDVTSREVNRHYSTGPPYVIHSRDVLALAGSWSDFVPPTFDQYPLLYAEMYAYSAAAAHLGLPHALVDGLYTGCMVGFPSERDDPGRREALAASASAFRESVASRGANDGGAHSCFLEPYRPPPFLHLCQRYTMRVGPAGGGGGTETYFYAKRRVDRDVLDCAHRPFWPFLDEEGKEKIWEKAEDWHTLAICSALRSINYARGRRCGFDQS